MNKVIGVKVWDARRKVATSFVERYTSISSFISWGNLLNNGSCVEREDPAAVSLGNTDDVLEKSGSLDTAESRKEGKSGINMGFAASHSVPCRCTH